MKIFILLSVLAALSGCADSVSFEQASQITAVGFWYGLWHGVTFPVAWVGSLFSEGISVYAIYNNGGWYDFGFFLGLGGFSATTASIK